MRRERSEHCVKVSKNRKTSISIRDKWKKRKNDTYLDDDVDAGFLRSVNAKDERKCIKDKLIEKDDVIDKKKNRVVNKLNKRKSNSTKVINSNVPVKSDDISEFDDNGGEAANAYDHERDDKNNRYVGLREAYVSQPSPMRTLNGMLKVWSYVNDPIRKYNLSYRRTSNVHLMFGSSIKSASHRHKNTKAGILRTSKFYDDKDLEKDGGRCRWDVACCNKVKCQKWIKLIGQQNLKEINFYKQLYLDQIAGCSSNKVISIVLGSRAEMRKLGLMDM
ncbi:11798_t:CDS:2, partial [Gigaspora rosea]